MKRIFLLLLLFAAVYSISYAQSNGDYRTRQSGWWSSTATWEMYRNGSWSVPNRPPRNQNAGAITVRTDHFLIADQSGRYDQILVEPGALLYNLADLTIDDGQGIDLQIEGLLWNYGTISTRNAASLQFQNGSTVFINSGDRLSLDRDATLAIEGGATVLNSGAIDMDDDAALFVESGGVLQNDSGITLSRNARGSISGQLVNAGSVLLTGSSLLTVETGGIFEHAQNGGALPDPTRTTWNPGSILEITGITQTLPSNLAHNVQTFIWNNVSQTANLPLGAAPASVSEDFIVRSTGSAAMAWDLYGAPLSVGRDLAVEAGVFAYQVIGSGMLSVSGNVSVASGATLDMAWSTGAPELRIGGNLTVNGLVRTGSQDRTSVVLEGPLTHTVSMAGTWRDIYDLSVINSGSLVMATDLSVSGSLRENAGGVDMAGHALALFGDVQLSRSPVNAGTVTFSGAASTTISSTGPALSFASIIVDRQGGSVALNTPVTAVSNVIVRSGTLITSATNLLSLPHGATLMNKGTVTGPIQMNRSFTLAQDGWRMLASPLSGVSYSSLNTPFHTQGRGWTDVSGGISNVKTFQFGSQDWSDVPDTDGVLTPGNALILYAFSKDALGKNILPTTWTVTGRVPAVGSQSLTFDASLQRSYNYAANPGTANIDWDATVSASSGVASSYATWDPALTAGGGTTGYRYYDAATGLGLAGRYIAPFTGIMTEATGPGATLAWSTTEAAGSASAEHFGKGGVRSLPPHVRLHIEGQGMADPETYLILSHDSMVPRLSPLSADWTTLWTTRDDKNLAFDARTPSDDHVVFDVYHAATKAGVYELSWPDVKQIPDGWAVTLFDLDSGTERNLLADSVHSFSVRPRDIVVPGSVLPEGLRPRFRIVMSSPDWAGLDDMESAIALPEEPLVLAQNYPNPFGTTTTIRFATRESGHVLAAVYDMLGRRVALLSDDTLEAGWHEVTWTPSGLAAGLYVYRLQLGSHSVVRTMSLLK